MLGFKLCPTETKTSNKRKCIWGRLGTPLDCEFNAIEYICMDVCANLVQIELSAC